MAENNPEGSNPYPKEAEPSPRGFHVRVEKPDLIYKAFQEGASGELGVLLLEDPIEKVSVEGFGQKDSFNIEAQIELSFSARYDRGVDEKDVIRRLAQGYTQRRERGGNFIIVAPGGTELIIGRGTVGLGRIRITTGRVEDVLEKIQAIPAPQLDNKVFEKVMRDFIVVLGRAVEDIYGIENKSSPREELVLHPPKERVRYGPPRIEDLFGKIETPKALLGKLEIERPDVTFEDIGGLPEAKREIQGLAFALKNPELYRKWGTKPPRGVVLFGPPGTGKTLLARALASQAEAQFFHVEASDIASKWYGESEQIVKTIFELAGKAGGKTIIFFDEIDAIAPHREGSHEATHRVISTLLENMDGLASKEDVMVVASTNRLESVEPALLRAGRFDRWVEAPLPDEQGRKQIFGIHMGKAQGVGGRELFRDINLDTLVAKTEKLSGADIAEIIRRALEEKVRQEGMGNHVDLVTTENILRELERYEKIRKTKRQIGFIPSPKET
ncbi:MAG: AAA family ATPase [Patescibacteria group bacterium]